MSWIGLAVITLVLRILRGTPRLVFRRFVGSLARRMRASNEWLPPEDARSYRNMVEVFEGVATHTR